MRVCGIEVMKGWACDKNVVRIFQGVATEATTTKPKVLEPRHMVRKDAGAKHH